MQAQHGTTLRVIGEEPEEDSGIDWRKLWEIVVTSAL